MVITGCLRGNMLLITKGTKYSIIYQYVKRTKSDRRRSLINESTKRPPISLGIEHKKVHRKGLYRQIFTALERIFSHR